VNLGPHPPRLWPEDVERLHRIWLRLTEDDRIGSKLHHRDVLSVALRRLEEGLESRSSEPLLEQIEEEMHRQHQEPDKVTAWSAEERQS
jgi:hypothetical protein